ncbi:MAG TPA: hypothetical protein VNT92_04100 [Acidimicrobiia bacterium]|nr:hypothetical protein [Acidimicrobiia bacterium]
MTCPTITNDQYDRLRKEIRGLRAEIDHQRRRIDRQFDFALVLSMAATVATILIVGLA